MKPKFTMLTSVTLVLISAIMHLSFTTKKKFSIDGAWSFIEVQTIKPDRTTTSTFPKEGVAIFSENNYSFCWTSHDFKLRSWQVADSVKVNRFNQSIINTGTFTLKDSILTTESIFAMAPMFSNGGIAKFKCSYSGDTLILKGLSVVSLENIAHPVYAGGSYFVSKLLRVGKRR